MNTGWLVVGCVVLLPFVIAAIAGLVVSEDARWVALYMLGVLAVCVIFACGVMAVLYGVGVDFE